MAKGDLIDGLSLAPTTLWSGRRVEEGGEEPDDIVHVDDLDLPSRIRDLNGHIAGDAMAEGRDYGVVIGAAPFAEDAGKAKDLDGRAGPIGVIEERLFCSLLGTAIGIV
jgi:hypothetical protein